MSITTQMSVPTLSSSKFSSAMGLSPWMSRKKLWRILTGREKPDDPTARMRWGTHNEHRAVAAVEAETGLLFDFTGEHQRSVKWENGWYSSTPDGISGEIGLEVKCPEKPFDDIPDHYLAQVQGQIYVCGLAEVYFACWGNTFQRIWRIPLSMDYQRKMADLLEEFRGYLLSDEEPPRLSRKPVMPPVAVEDV